MSRRALIKPRTTTDFTVAELIVLGVAFVLFLLIAVAAVGF